jgi:UDP-glucose 4-epimerase
VSFIDLAKKITEIAGKGRVAYTEFTQERKEVEPGDYYADVSRIKKVVKWAPKISLHEGIKKTIGFYMKHRKEYW